MTTPTTTADAYGGGAGDIPPLPSPDPCRLISRHMTYISASGDVAYGGCIISAEDDSGSSGRSSDVRQRIRPRPADGNGSPGLQVARGAVAIHQRRGGEPARRVGKHL